MAYNELGEGAGNGHLLFKIYSANQHVHLCNFHKLQYEIQNEAKIICF